MSVLFLQTWFKWFWQRSKCTNCYEQDPNLHVLKFLPFWYFSNFSFSIYCTLSDAVKTMATSWFWSVFPSLILSDLGTSSEWHEKPAFRNDILSCSFYFPKHFFSDILCLHSRKKVASIIPSVWLSLISFLSKPTWRIHLWYSVPKHCFYSPQIKHLMSVGDLSIFDLIESRFMIFFWFGIRRFDCSLSLNVHVQEFRY